MNTKNLKSIIDKQVDDAVDLIFANAHGVAMTTSGDITPEQQLQLDNIQEQLKTLVYNQVTQNIPEKEEAPVKQWNVPILRTGYSHAMIAVSARTEEEAIEKAIDEAGNESFSEKSSEYEAPDGAMEIN